MATAKGGRGRTTASSTTQLIYVFLVRCGCVLGWIRHGRYADAEAKAWTELAQLLTVKRSALAAKGLRVINVSDRAEAVVYLTAVAVAKPCPHQNGKADLAQVIEASATWRTIPADEIITTYLGSGVLGSARTDL